MTDACTPLLGPGREDERRIKSWHRPGCALLDRDVPCTCGGCPEHNIGQRYVATPEGYAAFVRRQREIGRSYVEWYARRVRRRIWPAPDGPGAWFYRDPVEVAEAIRRDKILLAAQQHARIGLRVNDPRGIVPILSMP